MNHLLIFAVCSIVVLALFFVGIIKVAARQVVIGDFAVLSALFLLIAYGIYAVAVS